MEPDSRPRRYNRRRLALDVRAAGFPSKPLEGPSNKSMDDLRKCVKELEKQVGR